MRKAKTYPSMKPFPFGEAFKTDSRYFLTVGVCKQPCRHAHLTQMARGRLQTATAVPASKISQKTTLRCTRRCMWVVEPADALHPTSSESSHGGPSIMSKRRRRAKSKGRSLDSLSDSRFKVLQRVSIARKAGVLLDLDRLSSLKADSSLTRYMMH